MLHIQTVYNKHVTGVRYALWNYVRIPAEEFRGKQLNIGQSVD